VLIEHVRARIDSGGPGEHRGGLGHRYRHAHALRRGTRGARRSHGTATDRTQRR
jgi:N-methylhydantoinase B/oxoprolinase/acetone carboxylase alpha subunit